MHVGAHRTGTSALQEALILSREDLAAAGIDVQTPPVFNRRDVSSHRRYLSNFIKFSDRFETSHLPIKALHAVRCKMAANSFLKLLPKANDRLVFSDENILGKAIRAERPGRIYPDADRRLKVVADLIGENVGTVALAIRPYHDFLVSYVAMLHAYGTPPLGFDELAAWAEQFHAGWCELADQIAAAFPRARLEIWPHSEFAVSDRFQMLTGCHPSKDVEDALSSRSNPAPTHEALAEIGRLEARGGLSKAARDAILLRHAGGRRIEVAELFDKPLIQSLNDRYRADLDVLAGR
ncbi:MAG: hypothetical protein KDJ29_03350 [Hyphomicrobiales bacterium]|nr:hypothetical protein [Hyphomicrobiales bacterium]